MGNYLLDPPRFGIFSPDQDRCIVCSENDVLFIDLSTGFELDIDEKEHVGDILNIETDEKYFYVIANKKNDILGYYMFMIEITNPTAKYEYLINWTNKTNIR